MKKQIILITGLLLFSVLNFGQSGPKFSVRISSDSILLGNVFQVAFSLENADGANFSAPELAAYFDVVGGPNTSMSTSFMNGQMSKSVTYTYYLKPRDIGTFYIEPASIETPEMVLETDPLEIMVVPNPDGIQQPLNQDPFQQGNPFMDAPGFNGFDNLNGFGGFDEMRKQMEKMFEGNDNFFKLLPEGFDQMGPDSLFFGMPPNMNFFQLDPSNLDSLFQQLPEEWRRMMPKDFAPVDPKKKKKRKIYKI